MSPSLDWQAFWVRKGKAMAIILGADAHGNALKELIKSFFKKKAMTLLT